MRFLYIFLLCLNVLLVAAESENPLLSPAASMEQPSANVDRFEFPEYGIDLQLPAGGSIEQPGDEGWDFSESVVCQWFHTDNTIHSALLMVDEFESPITENEFQFLSRDYYGDLATRRDDLRGIAEPALTEHNDRQWYVCDAELEDADGDFCQIRSWITYERHRLYTIACYYYDMNIHAEYGNTSADESRRIAEEEILKLVDGMSIAEPLALSDYELEAYEVPRHGLALRLPAAGEIVPGDDPELAGADIGPMEPSFAWKQPDAPAHAIVWFVFSCEEELPSARFALFVDGVWMGLNDTNELKPAPVSVVAINGRDWTCGETGYCNADNPEENNLVYLCQTPGGIQMVLAYTNRGYEELAAEQMELILETASFTEFTIGIPESYFIQIEEFGFSIELPGGGFVTLPGDDDWTYEDSSPVQYEWLHLNGPLTSAFLSAVDMGIIVTQEILPEVRDGLTQRLFEEKGAKTSKTLPDADYGGYTWMVYEFEYFINEQAVNQIIFLTYDETKVYALSFGFELEDREAALEQMQAAMESLVIE